MNGMVIAVLGGKGGVGKSVFTANYAIAHLKNFKQRPLIIDLDLQSLGDQNLILGQNPKSGISEICNLPAGPLDLKTLGPHLTNSSQGYSFISAPRDTTSARELNLDGLGRFLKVLPKTFDLTLIDCGSVVDAVVAKVLENVTGIFVITTADLMVINQTRRIYSRIQEMLFPPDMAQLILNRYNPSDMVSPQMVQKNLGRAIFGAIGEDVASCSGAIARNSPVLLAAPNSTVARGYNDLVRKVQQVKLFERWTQLLKGTTIKPAPVIAPAASGGESKASGPSVRSSRGTLDPWTAMKARIHKALVEKLDLKKIESDTSDPEKRANLIEKTRKAVLEVLEAEDTASLLPNREAKSQMVKEVLDEALALGPLEDLLGDPQVTEIMVNARDQIYVERSGKLSLSKVTFTSEQQMMNVVDRILMPLGRRVDEKVPYVDARLQDGSRVHIIIPPLALRGPTITIRKFPDRRLEMKDLVGFGSLTQEIGDFLRICVEARLNIIVSGGTGSGKTTLLNVLSNFIPSGERIITVEDAAELQLGQEHVVRLESRPKNIEGEGEVTIRDLVKSCLRMRPERIVVGEVRDGVALDMLQAMNTGHDGSMTTIHANNPRECMGRLETLVTMAGLGLPLKAIRETISSAVNIVIQQSRLSDGTRKVTYVTEVTGMQGDVISLQDIFVFKQEGLDKKRKIIGQFQPTGFIPKFVEEMEKKGMKISRGLFASKKPA